MGSFGKIAVIVIAFVVIYLLVRFLVYLAGVMLNTGWGIPVLLLVVVLLGIAYAQYVKRSQ